MDISALNTMKEYHDLFKERFGLSFDYGFAGRFCYISISRPSNDIGDVYAEAYGYDFDECIRHIQEKLCTYGLIPDNADIGPFPPFSSPKELEMKLSLMGK